MDNTTVGDTSLLGDRSRDRLKPLVSDAIAAGGGVVVAFGVLLIGINQYANSASRWPGALLFAALALIAYFALLFVPRSVTPSCIAAFAVAVPACFGFIFFPKVHEFGDLRPFFILTIGVWLVAWIAPRTTARPLFVALALLVFWLWMLGEIGGTSSYSSAAAPVPSPPYLSLTDFSHPAQVSVDQLDPNDPLYPTAQQCNDGDDAACDELWDRAPFGSDFATFAKTCGGRVPDGLGGQCEFRDETPTPTPTPRFGSLTPTRSNDKTTEIGVVSTVIGVVYLGAMMLLDRRRYVGLATAFVLPGIAALISGVSALGDRSRHLWVGGLLAVVAGLLIGVLGEHAERRFTAWFGGYTASVGALLIGLDTANSGVSIGHSSASDHTKLIGPGIIIIAFGVALVVVAFLVANALRTGRPGGPGTQPAVVPAAPAPWDVPAPSTPPPTPWGQSPPGGSLRRPPATPTVRSSPGRGRRGPHAARSTTLTNPLQRFFGRIFATGFEGCGWHLGAALNARRARCCHTPCIRFAPHASPRL